MNYWIITVAEPYCGYILRGSKTMEIRRRVPKGLNPGDIILIVRKGEKGRIVCACRVTSLITESVSYFCNNRLSEHRVSATALKKYAGDARFLVGIGVKTKRIYILCFYVQAFGFGLAPQWFYRINPALHSMIERYLL